MLLPTKPFSIWPNGKKHTGLRSFQMKMHDCQHFHFLLLLLEFIYFIFFSFYFNWRLITLQYCIGFAIHWHEWAMGGHVFHILTLPPTSLPTPSFGVIPVHPLDASWCIPVHQRWAPCLMRWTWTGDLFHIWYYTCFNATFSNHPTLAFSHRVQKTVLYICVSFAVSHIGLLLPSF